MNDQRKAIARTCLEGAEGNAMTFPQIVGALMETGFESYGIDFRRATASGRRALYIGRTAETHVEHFPNQ